jgi:magnesium chelatase family protein
VEKAAEIQRRRFAGTGCRRNARMQPAFIDRFCPLTAEAAGLFNKALGSLVLSGRAYHGILRTARTIADLAGSEKIHSDHIEEAVEYRRRGDDPFDILGAE